MATKLEDLEITSRTPQPECCACQTKALHTEEDWLHHPLKGHGFIREHGWTHPSLEQE